MSWTLVQKASMGGVGVITSLGVSLTGVTVGDLLTLSFSSYGGNGSTYTISDGHNSWVTGPTINAGSSLSYALSGSFYVVATTGGSLTFTVTSTTGNILALGVSEWSVAPGATISVLTTNTASGSGTFGSAVTLTYSGAGNCLAWAAVGEPGTITTPTAQNGWTTDNSIPYSAGNNYTDVDGHLFTTASSSPLLAQFSVQSSGPWATCGIVFLETPGVSTDPIGVASNTVMSVP
jgi:hypothetical protein